MVSLDTFRKLALAYPDVSEEIHFGMNAFAVGKLRFTAFDPKKGALSLLLSLTDPRRVQGIERGLLVPAPGKYGAEGWTTVDLENIGKPEFVALLEVAHRNVTATARAPKAAKTPKPAAKPAKTNTRSKSQ